jgi:hypothetical protein
MIIPPNRDESVVLSKQDHEQQIGFSNLAGTQAIAKRKDAQHHHLWSLSLLAIIAFWS